MVVENNVERLGRANHSQTPRLHHIYQSTVEVATPVASGILIICLVFLPLLSLQGLEGKMFAPVALAIIFALSGSLLLSLTLIPVLSSIFLKAGAHGEPLLMRVLTPVYKSVLNFSLRRPLPVILVAVGGLAAAGIAYGSVGKAFMPTMDEGAIVMQTTKLPSINLLQSGNLNSLIQRRLREKSPKSNASSRGSAPMSWGSIRWVSMKPTISSCSSPRTSGANLTRTGCWDNCAKQWPTCPGSNSPSHSPSDARL